MTTKICKKCGRRYYGNLSSKYCSIECGRDKNYEKNKEKILKKAKKYRKLHPEKRKESDHRYYLQHKKEYIKRAREWESKHPRKAVERNKKSLFKFRTEKREQFNQLIMKNYYTHKKKWLERNYVRRHRKKFLELLPKKCIHCRKKPIKIIAHLTYNVPKRKDKRTKQEEFKKYLIKYSKVLLPFCSKKCRNKYLIKGKKNE